MSTEQSRNDTRGIDESLAQVLRDRGRTLLKSPIVVVLWISLTLIGVIAQPYDSYGILPLWAGLLYWGGISGGAIVAVDLLDFVARRRTPSGDRILIALKAIALTTAILSPIFIMWNELFVLGFPDMDDSPWVIAFRVLATSVPVFAVLEAIRPHVASEARVSGYAPAEAEPCPETMRPRLVARLQNPEARILRLSANNHLIDVISDQGQEQIRLRFADAVLEMEPVEGCCVHRSHWVARAAIQGLLRRKGKLFVLLRNGDEIPVSRTYRPELEAARPDLF